MRGALLSSEALAELRRNREEAGGSPASSARNTWDQGERVSPRIHAPQSATIMVSAMACVAGLKRVYAPIRTLSCE